MKTTTPRIVAIALLSVFCMANTECSQDGEVGHAVVSTKPGEAAAALEAARQHQIDELKVQTLAAEARAEEQARVNAIAAGSVHGIAIAASHLEDSAAKEAILAEAKLAAEALKANEGASPAIVAAYARAALEAEQRVTLFLTGQLEKARLAYGSAQGEIDTQRKLVSAKEAEITSHKAAYAALEGTVEKLKGAAQKERDDAAAKIQAVIDDREHQIKKLRDEQAAKERRMWLNVLRFGGIGFIGLGILAIALSKGEMWMQGGIMIGGGAGTIGMGLAIDILTSQWWFPWAFGLLCLTVAVGGAWVLWDLHRKHQLAVKSAAVFDDVRTESGHLWQQLQPFIDYRLGQAGQGLRKTMDAMAVRVGLSEKGDPALAAPTAAPPA